VSDDSPGIVELENAARRLEQIATDLSDPGTGDADAVALAQEAARIAAEAGATAAEAARAAAERGAESS
jgi:hypothetical protein